MRTDSSHARGVSAVKSSRHGQTERREANAREVGRPSDDVIQRAQERLPPRGRCRTWVPWSGNESGILCAGSERCVETSGG